MVRNSRVRRQRKARRWLAFIILIVIPVCVLLWLLVGGSKVTRRQPTAASTTKTSPAAQPTTGKIVEQSAVTSYTAQQAEALIKQDNPSFNGQAVALKSQTFRYTMLDTNGQTANVYARVFIPEKPSSNQLPVYAFAPGTTGIDDQCAASLEVPAKRNWANYASHMAAYASSGYVTVITDYEGMRDPTRMHHYMVGQLEGRALLDSVRAMTQLPLTKKIADTDDVFVAGYSQGGHAAYWADEIAGSYAPELGIKGVVGFGPVTDVRQTLTDTTRGANILWFGPYLLTSYSDWYKEVYPVASILMPPYKDTLAADIAKNCIDTNIGYWGNRDINKVYTQEFIQAMKTGSVASISPTFNDRMVQNLTADTKTPTRKRINQGRLDNVILPSQSDAAVQRLCKLGTPVTYQVYADATHYSTMTKSFNDTLNWMKAVRAGTATPNDCR